jgi:hypothetical protein
MKHLPFKRELRESNLVKYKGVPPNIELVKKTIEKSNLSRRSFEITYGIVEKTIERYLDNLRGMPMYYWHIFYEFDNLEKFYTNFKGKKKRKSNQVIEKPPPVIAQTNKSIIDAYRTRINK